MIRFGWMTPVASAVAIAVAAAGQDPTIGPQIRVDVAGGTAASNETSAAANAAGTVVASWNDWRDSTGVEIIRIGVALSTDGGRTWTDFLLRPPAPFQTTVEGDPMTACDPASGTIWVGGIAFSGGGMYAARLDPGDDEFQEPVMIQTGGGLDKPWMTVGSVPGFPSSVRLYVASNVGVHQSNDMGDSWSGPVSLGSGLGFLPRVGPNGEVYVAFWDTGSQQFSIKRSLNGGVSYTTHDIATRMDTWGIGTLNSRFPGTFRVPPLCYLAVDPNDGTLYAVYMDTTDMQGSNFNVDLYFAKSVDQGTSWTTPVVINGDADPPGDQFFPWLEVDDDGRLHLVFLDSRHTVQQDNTVNGMFDAYYSWSDDGGDTWTEHRLTPQSWNSDDDGLDRPQQFIGDYLGLAKGGGTLYPVYLDTSNGDTDVMTHVIETGDLVDPDVNGDGVVDVADLVEVILAWGDCPPDCPADTNGDGVVDVADMVNVILAWS